MKKIILFGTLLLLSFTSEPAEAQGGCQSCFCWVFSTDVNFGMYDPLTGAAVDSTGDVTVICGTFQVGSVMSYEVILTKHRRGRRPRRMQGPRRPRLEYNLFTDPARTIIWGNGRGTTGVVTDSYTMTSVCCEVRTYTIYGRIFSGQNVRPGLFEDSIEVRINF